MHHQVLFPSVVNKCFPFPISISASVIIYALDLSHSEWGKIKSQRSSKLVAFPWCLRILNIFFQKFFRSFLHLHFKCYPESTLYPPQALLPYLPTPTSWAWCSPVLGHIKFACPMGLSFQWWPTRPSSDTYAARDTSSRSTGMVMLFFHL